MLVHQSASTITATVKNISPQQLADVRVGQRLDIEVSKAVAVGDTVTVNIAGKSTEFRMPVALQSGQTIPVELVIEEGKLALKILSGLTPAPLAPSINSAAPLDKLNLFTASDLRVGQQVAVEVVKLLAENRLLVQTVVNASANGKSTTTSSPQQFDIDITKLVQQPKIGDTLDMKVVSIKPLNIQFIPPAALPREQRILDNIRQLLSRQVETPQLKVISNLIQQQSLPDSIRQVIDQLVQHTADKTQLSQPGRFQQAVSSSGTFMESKMLNQPMQANQSQDFKANLGKLLNVVELSLADIKNGAVKPELNNLPSQVPSALSVAGKTPAQLLNVLLSNNYRVPLLLTPSTSFSSTINSPEQALSLAQLLTKPLTPLSQSLAASSKVVVSHTELLQLFKEVEGVHSKLQLNQLMTLKEPESSNVSASWLFDVPIKDKHNLDLIQMQIDQHKHGDEVDKDNDIWKVKLRLDTQNLGPVQAMVTYHQSDVKIALKAERNESAELLTQYLPELEAAMDKLDLTTSQVSCSCGAVEKATTSNNSAMQQISTGLVDISV